MTKQVLASQKAKFLIIFLKLLSDVHMFLLDSFFFKKCRTDKILYQIFCNKPLVTKYRALLVQYIIQKMIYYMEYLLRRHIPL